MELELDKNKDIDIGGILVTLPSGSGWSIYIDSKGNTQVSGPVILK